VRTRGADAAQLLLEAARRLDPFSPALAREAYLEALRAAIFTKLDISSRRELRGALPEDQPALDPS
jgi:hypothetical protein